MSADSLFLCLKDHFLTIKNYVTSPQLKWRVLLVNFFVVHNNWEFEIHCSHHYYIEFKVVTMVPFQDLMHYSFLKSPINANGLVSHNSSAKVKYLIVTGYCFERDSSRSINCTEKSWKK